MSEEEFLIAEGFLGYKANDAWRSCHKAVEWAKFGLKGCLYLHGPPGSGKTFMGLGIALAFKLKKPWVRLVTPSRLIDAKTERNVDVTATYGECELLLLDDLGTQNDHKFCESILFEVINARFCRNLPIIITSNLSPEELEKKTYDRILSRLKPLHACELKGLDWRGLEKNQ